MGKIAQHKQVIAQQETKIAEHKQVIAQQETKILQQEEQIAEQEEKKEIAEQVEEEIKKEKDEEPMKLTLTNAEFPKRIVEFFSMEETMKTEKKSNENEIIKQMTDGRIPMGFSCHPLWSVAHDKLRTLPTEISEKTQKVAALSETIQKLQKELKIATETHASLQSQIAPLIRFCERKLPPLIECSAVFAKVEKKLNFSVDSHLTESTVDEFISLDHVAVEKNEIPPKISILFNCAGISHESIKKLSTVDGEEFTE